jgi:hypothetical protein
MDPLDPTKLLVIKAINNGLNFVSKGDEGHYDEL